ncbi:Uncharacterised protein [Mycobacteroides abscessus subsp. abscessus]|nr:Uncharacterised protein [Mycobacteroides abscessus subsp. abscessus]
MPGSTKKWLTVPSRPALTAVGLSTAIAPLSSRVLAIDPRSATTEEPTG